MTKLGDLIRGGRDKTYATELRRTGWVLEHVSCVLCKKKRMRPSTKGRAAEWAGKSEWRRWSSGGERYGLRG